MKAKSRESGIMAQGELERIWKWNQICPKPINRCVHEIIEEKVRAQPNKLALCAWDGEIRYGELNQLATELAYRLTSLGVKAGQVIPLCFEKSMWTTVAILGVLKAGGTFLLLDPSLPERRLAGFVQQVRADLILCAVSLKALSSRLARDVLAVHETIFMDIDVPASWRQPRVSPSSNMYLNFTSGSTGAPKAAVLTHCNYASALYHQTEHLGFTTESRIYDFSSYCFDASISHVFTTLAAGGCLCVPMEHDRRNKLTESITSLRANTIALTPSVAQLLDPDETPTLHTIIFIAEPLHLRDICRWWDKARVLNLYGPSECTPLSVINSRASGPQEATRIGIGAGLVTWVVHPENHENLLPIGATGELLLEGPLIGEGYLNDPEKTARTIVNDPMWLQNGASNHPGRYGRRLYKTGDLVHYNEDGSLTFVGRKDTQVKIHGQRIELGEIEHCLQEHLPDVKQIVVEVITPKGKSSTHVLAAFIQSGKIPMTASQAESAGTVEPYEIAASVEDSLAQHLPRYMVPTLFFSIDELPIAATGKLDRRRLCEMGGSSFHASIEKRPPVTEPNAWSSGGPDLQKMVSRVLAIDQAIVGPKDNFFRLGGNSITAMRLVSEARTFGVELTVSNIFQNPTLDNLTVHCHPLLDKDPDEIPPFTLLGDQFNKSVFLQELAAEYHLDPGAVEDAYPCTPLQEGLLSLTLGHTGEYMIQRTLELPPTVELRGFCRAWEDMARSNAILRTRIVQLNNIGLIQLVLNEGIEWEQAIGLERYLEVDKQRPMGLGNPLARYCIVTDYAGVRRWFVWTLHHALYDGWSLSLMTDMADRAYHDIPTRPPGPEFKAFVRYVGKANGQEAAKYWQDSLRDCDCAPFPALPLSVKRPTADSEFTQTVPWLATRSGDFTTSTLVRASWALLVSRMTNSDKVVFGITTSGRSAPVRAIDEVMGPTVATVPLYVTLNRSQPVRDYLEALQLQTAGMIPFEHFGLHRIAKISPEARQACMFQTLIVIHPEDNDRVHGTLGRWQDTQQPEWVNTFALGLEVQPGTGTIRATFDTNVVKPWVVRNMLDVLESIMKQLDGAAYGQNIAEVEIVTPNSLEWIWNCNSFVPAPTEALIHHIVGKMMQKQPGATAICAWDGELTYGELDQLATTVAHQLVDIGVDPYHLGPDILVPLCFEKSKWTVVSMLGVLRAGAGFVLLDPSLPRLRLQSIVNQVGARLLLSSHANMNLGHSLSEMVIPVGPEILQTPCLGPGDTKHTATPPPPSSRTMYAVFTSGSTGSPKGVLVSHENFCSALCCQLEPLGFTGESRVLDFASYAFDAAIHNALATLVAGGCLCIPSDNERKESLENVMISMRPTIANLTPTVARLLNPVALPNLRTLILLGEPVTARDAEQWQSHGIRLINAYGPAECTPISTFNVLTLNTGETIGIGKGVGLATWVADPEDDNRLLPPGGIGELLLEGPLVGNGYMKDPKKTAEVFISNPSWLLRGSFSQPGRSGRLYKTGDLVQYEETGGLTFIGRKDSQVKIRGQRFELEEVEHHILADLPAKASQAATEIVMLEDGVNPRSVLVAFIQLDTDGKELGGKASAPAKAHPLAADIKRRLASQLPGYMVPEAFLAVSEVPLTATGKTNRKQLRDIARQLLHTEGEQIFATSGLSVPDGSTSGEWISEHEHPAYTLALKIHSLRPSWSLDPLSLRRGESSHTGLRDMPLHSSGLDSVNMMELGSFISQTYRIPVGMRYLMDQKATIRSLAEDITASSSHRAECGHIGKYSTQVDLMVEINQLDSKILAAQDTLAIPGNVKGNDLPADGSEAGFRVLLTGANGFVGTQILRHLLEHQRVRQVICLARGDTDEAARRRIINKAMEALWWREYHGRKLEIWRGDLALPILGLDRVRWDFLKSGRGPSIVIHSGAAVHWTKSYHALEAANVGSTMDLLLLALGHRSMRFLYVTGGRPWASHEEVAVIKELSAPDAIPYSQTKLVGEIVVRRAAERTPSLTDRVAVFNPGWVIGTPSEGFSNPNDYIWRLAAICIRIGAYNVADADGWLSISDATTTATAIVGLALDTATQRRPDEHRLDGMTWKEFWPILGNLGYELQPKGMTEWLSLVRADIEATKDLHPLWPLAHLIEGLQNDERVAGRSPEKRGSTPLRLRVAVQKCAKFLVGVGFLPPPPPPPPRTVQEAA